MLSKPTVKHPLLRSWCEALHNTNAPGRAATGQAFRLGGRDGFSSPNSFHTDEGSEAPFQGLSRGLAASLREEPVQLLGEEGGAKSPQFPPPCPPPTHTHTETHSPAPPLAFPRQAVGEEGSPAVCLSACFQKSPLLGGEGTLILLSPPMLPGKSIQPLFSPKLPSSSPSLCPVPSRGTTSG